METIIYLHFYMHLFNVEIQTKKLNNLIFLVVNCCGVAVQRECGRDQFKCKNENKNQILSINDFNKEREKCIPRYYRCDGRSNLFIYKD